MEQNDVKINLNKLKVYWHELTTWHELIKAVAEIFLWKCGLSFPWITQTHTHIYIYMIKQKYKHFWNIIPKLAVCPKTAVKSQNLPMDFGIRI